MKKIFMIGLALMLPLTDFCLDLPELTTPSKVFSYIGSFQFVGVADKSSFPSLGIYYNGNHIACQQGTFVVTDKKKETFFIIITHLEIPTANTIARLVVPKNKPYILYALQRVPVTSSAPDAFEETWEITTQEGKGPWAVPEDALVIIMDPACVKTVSQKPWSKEGISILLPTIILHKNADKTDAYNRSLLANLDIKPFHKENDFVTCKQTSKSISSFRKQ